MTLEPALVWLLGFLAWVPASYGLTLILKDWLQARRQRQRARPPETCSVGAIIARVEREAMEHRESDIHWPRADPDRAVLRDERPTVLLPLPSPIKRSIDELSTEPVLPPLPPSYLVRPYVRTARFANQTERTSVSPTGRNPKGRSLLPTVDNRRMY